MKEHFEKLKEWAIDVARNAPKWVRRFHEKMDPEGAEDEYDRTEGFFQLTFALLAAMVRADGVVDPKELAFVHFYINSRFNFSEERRTLALEVFEDTLESSVSAADYAKGLRALFPHSEVILTTTLEILFDLAIADGVLAKDEEDLLREIAAIFGHDEKSFERLKKCALDSHFGPKEARYHNVLGSRTQARLSELTKCHREQLWRYDIERLRKDGLPDEFLLLARKRIEDIEEAYAVLAAELRE